MPHKAKMENEVAKTCLSPGGAELPTALRKAQRVRSILIQLGQRERRARDAGIEATFDDLSFEGGDGPQRVLPKIVPFGAALALAGAVSVWALHWQGSPFSDAVSLWTPASSVTHAMSKPFADIAIDANLVAQLKSAAPVAPSSRSRASNRAPASPFRCLASKLFRPRLRRSRRPGACRCRPGAMCPRSARRKAFPCRPPVRLGSAPRPVHCARSPCVATRRGGRASCRPARQSQRHRETLRMGAPIRAGRSSHHLGAHRRHPAGRRRAKGESQPPPRAASAEARCSASRRRLEIRPQRHLRL